MPQTQVGFRRFGALVYIRRKWNDEKVSAVPFDQFHNPYWDDISGEMMQRAPRPFIHGHVWCTDVQDHIAHLHAHGDGPHWIKVCVVRKDNNRETFRRLLEIVGPRPKWKMGEHWP
jgi:hypothetical protein